MKEEKFSVLISVYRKENPNYFDAALESVYKNTICPNEVVICEDGELTEDLDKIIRKYTDLYPRITKIVKFKKNRGLGYALHDGVFECSNEIVFRMDADDVCLENRFSRQLEILKSTNVDVIGSNIVEYDENMRDVFGVKKVPEVDVEIKNYAKRRNPINHMTACFKKSKVIESGNYQDMPGFEDYYLWIRMMKAGCKFYNVQECLVKVRGGDSMMRRRGGKGYFKKINHFEKTIRNIGFISTMDYCFNVFVRTVFSVVTPGLRSLLYSNFLRKRALLRDDRKLQCSC